MFFRRGGNMYVWPVAQAVYVVIDTIPLLIDACQDRESTYLFIRFDSNVFWMTDRFI